MIIPADKAEKLRDQASVLTEDPPPTYVSSQSPTPSSSSLTPRPQSCNYISFIKQNHPIKGTFAVDPSIHIPPALLPPLPPGEQEEDRKNLRLESHNCTVDADILLADGGGGAVDNGRVRTTLSLRSHNGSVLAKVSDTSGRRPVHIAANSKNGTVIIYLPRSFQGFLTLSSQNASIVLSDELSRRTTTFSHVSHTDRCFVGDLCWTEQDGEWKGDEVVASSHNGKVRLSYIDELNGEKDKENFLSRVFLRPFRVN